MLILKQIFVCILFFTALVACASKKTSGESNSKKGNQNLTYLALGDSYTIGEAVNKKDRWPLQLESALIREGFNISTTIIAKTGWRTDNLLNAAKRQISTEKYDLVSLLIGVNNEYQGEDPNNFELKFRSCLTYAIAHSKKGKDGVFVVSIPDYGYTPFGEPNQLKISERLAQYNAISASVCQKENIPHINITPISQKGLKEGDLVANDGLHPSGVQYTLWVEMMLSKVIDILGSD